MNNQFELEKFDVAKFDSILSRGLSKGLGKLNGQVCIEAAICQTLGLPHGDDPGCVSAAVRAFKITLNDAQWSSPQARAAGLRNLGLAQLGSKGVVDDSAFATLLSEKIIRVLIPKLFRELFPKNAKCLAAADACEREGTESTARAARAAWSAARAADAAARAAAWTAARAAADAAWTVTMAAKAAKAADAAGDSYLVLAANLALDVLRELKSPGVVLLSQ